MAAPALPDLKNEIHLVRGERVMLDSALAEIYGVPTKRLNEQFKRNRKRFPLDFAFQLTRDEWRNLISQTAISKAAFAGAERNLKSQFATSSSHGGRRKLPWVFTEHGAIMLATVLNSDVAVAASVRVVRAFVQMRELISANVQLARKFSQLERRLDTNDAQIKQLFDVIREMLTPAANETKREIGFHVREESPRYRTRKKT